MDHAALVEFNESTMLSESEYKLLKCALQLARSEEKEAQAIVDALQGYLKDAGPKFKGLPLFFTFFMDRLGGHCDEVQGMLIDKARAPIFIEEERHVAALASLLEILQSGGWLAGFMASFRLKMWAEECPTPLDVMQELVEQAENFECDIHDAKRMLERWPQFFPSHAATAKPRDTMEAKPSDETDYVLNEYDSKGNLAKAIWMSRGQYDRVKKTLLEQGCEVVDEKAKATAAGRE
jgi:hypothetical protein